MELKYGVSKFYDRRFGGYYGYFLDVMIRMGVLSSLFLVVIYIFEALNLSIEHPE